MQEQRVSPAHDVEELLLDLLRDRARLPRPHPPVVDFPHGSDLGRRAGKEHLLGDVHLVPREPHFLHGEVQLVRDREHGVPRDPRQDRGEGRGLEDSVPDDEDVLPRCLGHVSFRVEQDRLVVAGFHYLPLGENGVDVVPVDLSLGHRSVDVVPVEGGDLGSDLFFESLGSQVRPPRPDGDGHMDGVRAREKPHLPFADEYDGTDVPFDEAVGVKRLPDGLVDLLGGVWGSTWMRASSQSTSLPSIQIFFIFWTTVAPRESDVLFLQSSSKPVNSSGDRYGAMERPIPATEDLKDSRRPPWSMFLAAESRTANDSGPPFFPWAAPSPWPLPSSSSASSPARSVSSRRPSTAWPTSSCPPSTSSPSGSRWIPPTRTTPTGTGRGRRSPPRSRRRSSPPRADGSSGKASTG